ncbi:MAG: hypothetical protein Q7K21_07915 [Elusimicrobiota bacterium]|nr:hypothetical protein [Elusimicrobiota bacterium]
MAIVNTLKIYEILKPAFQDAQAKVITDVIEKSLEEYQKEPLATKQDIAEEIAKTIVNRIA